MTIRIACPACDKAAIYDYLYDMQRSPAPDLNAAAAQELGRNEGPASPPLPAEG